MIFISYHGKITGFGSSLVDIGRVKMSMNVLLDMERKLRTEWKDRSIMILNWKEIRK